MPSVRARAAIPARHKTRTRGAPLSGPGIWDLRFLRLPTAPASLCGCCGQSSAREPSSSSEKSGVGDGDVVPLVAFVRGCCKP